jgi:hypothetical protein
MRSPEFIRKVVSSSKDELNRATQVSTVTALLGSLYEHGVFSDEDYLRLYLAYCHKNKNHLNKGELGLAFDQMVRQPELTDVAFDEMKRHDDWATLAQSLRSLSEAVKCFRSGQYDTFETLLCNVNWTSIDANHRALVNRTSMIGYMHTLRPPLATRSILDEEEILDKIRGFYRDISFSCFVESLTDCAIEQNRLAAFTSCDLTYYSAFAELLCRDTAKRGSVFLVIILCCSTSEEGTARAMAVRFNETFAKTALTIVQVHQKDTIQRSFYTVPRLLALGFWVCALGRDGISLDIDVLPGPKFDQLSGGSDSWDVILPIKPEGWPWSKVFAAYIRVNSTPAGREFARAFLTYLLETVDPARYQWHIDQNALLVGYIRAQREKRVKVYDIWDVFSEVIFVPSPGGLQEKIEEITREISSRPGLS